MATAYVSIGKAGAMSSGASQPVFRGRVRTETVTTSGTAASGALTASTGDIAQIVCATAVIASALTTGGAASATNGVYCPAGIPTYLGLSAGDVVSLIDA